MSPFFLDLLISQRSNNSKYKARGKTGNDHAQPVRKRRRERQCPFSYSHTLSKEGASTGAQIRENGAQ